jgi:acyl carrier protein
VPVDAIAPTSTFEQLDVDSLRGLRIVAEVERRYGIVIPEEKIGQIRSMQDIFALVDRYPAEG